MATRESQELVCVESSFVKVFTFGQERRLILTGMMDLDVILSVGVQTHV